MITHSFSDFSYAINTTSKKKGHKEILVCFIYNGVEVLKKVYIKEAPGTAYIFEAKQIIDKEMRSGALSSYSHKFVKKKKKEEEKAKKKSTVANAKVDNKSNSTAPKKSKKKWIFAGVTTAVVAALILGTYFITKSLNPANAKEYPVSFNVEGCEYKGESIVEVGKPYECTFSPVADETVAIDFVKMGSDTLKEGEGYTFVNNILTIQKVADANIIIKAHTTPLAYKVTFNGVGCKISDESAKNVAIGAEYQCDIKADKTTESPIISEITMSGTPLTDLDYTFEKSHLHITKGATGPINITAGVETTIFNVTCDCGSDLTFSGEQTVSKGATQYSCQIVPKDSDKRQTNIDSVRMGGKALTPGKDYNFNYETNNLNINVSVTGDISIVATTTITKYEVNYHLSNCDMALAPAEIEVGGYLSCTLIEQEGSRKNAIAGVSMGGIKLDKNQYDFSDTTNTLSLKVGATGDIVVSAMSYDPGTDFFVAKFESGEGCVTVSPMTDIKLGSNISTNLKVTDTENKKVYIDAVVMGGVSLKEGSGYTFDPTIGEGKDNFTVFNVTSNVLVKFSAIDIGDITATPTYTLSEDKQSYMVTGFELPSGKNEEDIDSITIEPSYAPKNSNAEPLPVTSIAAGSLNKFSNLKELSIPFIGAKKISGSEDLRDGTQLFGYIFGDTPYSGSSATWQYYYDESEVLHPRKFIIPNSLKIVTVTGDDPIIPAGAFSSCRSIDEIKFTQNKATVVKNYAFNGCVSLRTIEIPEAIATIEESVFQNCETLQSINLPDNLTTVAAYAFNNCKSLLKVRLSNRIEQVGKQAFTGIRGGIIACEKTKSQIEASSHWDKEWVDLGTPVAYGAINTEDYIDTTGQFHFMLVKSDDGADTIGAHVAEYVGDSTQSTITIPDKITPQNTTDEYPIFVLGDYMFSEYSVTTKFVFNCSQLTTIGSYCFSYCSTLEQLEGFNNLTKLKEIGAYCFGACLTLSISSIPNSVSSLGEYAFAYNYGITSFDLSNNKNIKSIEEGLFYYCVNMSSVTLPEGITHLGDNVFEECYALTSLEINSTGITTLPYALCYCVEDQTHPERVSKLASFTWSSSTPLTTIGGSAFGGCSALTNVKFGSSTANHLPTSVGTVGDYAFTRCTKISSFYIDYSSTGVSNINMGLEVFKNWTSSQKLLINTNWVTGGGFGSTEATLKWGWKLSRTLLSGNFHCSKTGSNDLVINKAN